MSRRSAAAYFSSIERVYSHCRICGTTGARYSKRDQQTLCKTCRDVLKSKGLAGKVGIQHQ